MARATTETLLPLDTWALKMGINPWEFNQIGEGFPVANTQQCEHVWFQTSWMQDFLSREEVAICIAQAEDMIGQELGYYPAPKYFRDEVQSVTSRNWDGSWPYRLQSVQLDHHKVQGGGILNRTLVASGIAVTVSDRDGDGVWDTFTAVTPAQTVVTDPGEVAAYFTITQRAGAPLDETWRIRPIISSITAGVVSIEGPSYLVVNPLKTLGFTAASLDVTSADTYIGTIDIYRVFRDDSTDPANQGNAIWENPCLTPPCSVEYDALCIGDRRGETGFVSVAWNQNGCCPNANRPPDRVSINYLAGEPLINYQMSNALADVVAHLATALLPGDKCGCERSTRIVAYWRTVAPAQGEGLRADIAGNFGVNPFGPQRGAVYAWSRILKLRQLT